MLNEGIQERKERNAYLRRVVLALVVGRLLQGQLTELVDAALSLLVALLDGQFGFRSFQEGGNGRLQGLQRGFVHGSVGCHGDISVNVHGRRRVLAVAGRRRRREQVLVLEQERNGLGRDHGDNLRFLLRRVQASAFFQELGNLRHEALFRVNLFLLEPSSLLHAVGQFLSLLRQLLLELSRLRLPQRLLAMQVAERLLRTLKLQLQRRLAVGQALAFDLQGLVPSVRVVRQGLVAFVVTFQLQELVLTRRRSTVGSRAAAAVGVVATRGMAVMGQVGSTRREAVVVGCRQSVALAHHARTSIGIRRRCSSTRLVVGAQETAATRRIRRCRHARLLLLLAQVVRKRHDDETERARRKETKGGQER